METIAEWVAPAATMIAATIVALNLGARITGWGFIVFTVGSLGWIILALATGQQGLLVTNILLTLINLIGIWRWLGREAKLADGAEAAALASRHGPDETLTPLALLIDCPVRDPAGKNIGRCAGGMIDRDNGTVRYLVIREGGVGGVGERFHALSWDELRIGNDAIDTALDCDSLAALPEIDAQNWPASPVEPAVAGT